MSENVKNVFNTSRFQRGNTADDRSEKPRIMMHLDMDAFFVNVELLNKPELHGTPIIVAHEGPRSVVCSASYEARDSGVQSGMPLARAKRLSPQATILPLRGDYGFYSRAVMRILRDESPLVEQVSVDEAFIDLTGATAIGGSPVAIAQRVRERIADELSLPCSAGISINKFLAKMASTGSKPNGLWVVPPHRVQEFLDPMPVNKLWGVGARSATLLNEYGIYTVAQLREFDAQWLCGRFGNAAGNHLYALARGIDHRPVVTERVEKSMGAEHTFAADTRCVADIERAVQGIALRLGRRLRAAGKTAGALTIKYRYEGFETHTKSIPLTEPVDSGMQIYRIACAALRAMGLLIKSRDGQKEQASRALRLIGVRAERLQQCASGVQQTLFTLDPQEGDGAEKADWGRVERALDGIHTRFSAEAVRPASLMGYTAGRTHMHRVQHRQG